MFGVRTYFSSTFDTKWRCQAKFHSSISGDWFNFCNQFFNLGMRIYEKIEKSIHESKLFIKKSWKDFQSFDLFFFSINFLNLKRNYFFVFDQSLTCDSTSLEVIHQKKSITVIGLIVQNILTKIKLYSGIKATWQLSYTWFIYWAFRQTGKTGKKYLKKPGIHRKYF